MTRNQTAHEDRLLTVREACHTLGIGATKCWALIASGDLPTVRIGDRIVRVSRRAIDEFIATHSEAVR